MIFVLLESLFRDPPDEALLIALLRQGVSGRHRLRTRPAFKAGSPPAVHAWLGTLTANLRETAALAFERGQQAPSYAAASEPIIEVGDVAHSVWTRPPRNEPSRLTLQDAHDLASRPLRLLLENARNDFGFLRKIVPESWKEQLARAISRRWIEPSGGGIDEMRKVIEQQLARDDLLRLSSWAMFDSDARRRGVPSESAKKNRSVCERTGVSFCQLERRAIENYIPRESLYNWADRGRSSLRRDRRGRVDAYVGMRPPERRHFYNLKEGFKGDGAVSDLYGSPCEGEPPVERPSPLDHGIDKDIAQIWREDEFQVPEHALLREEFESERAALFQSLFGRM